MGLLAFLEASVLFPMTARADAANLGVIMILPIVALVIGLPVLTPIFLILYAILRIRSSRQKLDTMPSFWTVILSLPSLFFYPVWILGFAAISGKLPRNLQEKYYGIDHSVAFWWSAPVCAILLIFCSFILYRDIKRFRKSTAIARKKVLPLKDLS